MLWIARVKGTMSDLIVWMDTHIGAENKFMSKMEAKSEKTCFSTIFTNFGHR
jgi:hypothetical protein